MYEAVNELGDKSERKLFEQTIPAIPQKLIPRWKRKLYEPQATPVTSNSIVYGYITSDKTRMASSLRIALVR